MAGEHGLRTGRLQRVGVKTTRGEPGTSSDPFEKRRGSCTPELAPRALGESHMVEVGVGEDHRVDLVRAAAEALERRVSDSQELRTPASTTVSRRPSSTRYQLV
jgi:hypothetical protein